MNLRSQTIDWYLATAAKFARLAEEVAVIIEGRLNAEQVPFASVIWRQKTLDSLLSKVQRKGYDDPVTQVSDMAGVRVVFLYPVDFPRIAEIINTEFSVVSSTEKPASNAYNQFGYGAHHYNVRLVKRYYGPRYDFLRDFSCEVQVRTVLQDAWALVSHHLEYKNEESVPIPLRRQLHALAGAFEVADSHLDQLRKRRSDYAESLGKLSAQDRQATELNYDAFLKFIAEANPGIPVETTPGAAQSVHSTLRGEGIQTVGDLSRIYQLTKAARKEFFDREGWGSSQARQAFVALGLAKAGTYRLFAQESDIELLKELRKKYKTISEGQ